MLKTEIIDALPHLSNSDRREILHQLLNLPLPRTRYREGSLIVEEQDTPELPGQVLGHWFSEVLPVPPGKRPGYPPDGAILPYDGTLEDNIVALALVPIEGIWWPMSEAAQYTYHYTADLNTGLPCWFMPVAGHLSPDTSLYSVKWGTPLSQGEVVNLYGAQAGARARDDYLTVQLMLRRIKS